MANIKKWIFLITVVLCGTVLYLPAFDQPMAIRFIVLCLAAMAMVICSKEFRVGSIHIFACMFVVSVLLSGAFAVNKAEWLYWTLRAFLMITLLSVLIIDEKLLAKTMIFLGIVFTAYFWWEFFRQSESLGFWQFEGMSGLMRQKNYWATAHFVVIPFCYYAIEKKFWRIVAIPVMLSMIANIILLGSRSGVLALFVMVIVLSLLNKKVRWYAVVVCVIGGIGFSQLQMCNFESFNHRIEQWIPTLKMIWHHPFGVGAGNWWLLFPKYAPDINFPDAFEKTMFRFPHNDFLWVWVETGFLGIIGYLGMFIVALCSAYKKKAIYLIIAISGYMAVAFFAALRERPFSSLIIILFFILACERKDKIKCFKSLLIPLTLFLVVLCFYLRSSCWYRKMKNNFNNLPQYQLLCTRGYSVFTPLTYSGIPYDWWAADAQYRMGNKVIACVYLERAYKYNPGCVPVIYGKGVSCYYQKKFKEAKEYFEEVLRICPDNKEAKYSLKVMKNVKK